MTIDDFAYEYKGLTKERQLEGFRKLFDYLLSDIEEHHGLLMAMLGCAGAEEADDYFGTEGFRI